MRNGVRASLSPPYLWKVIALLITNLQMLSVRRSHLVCTHLGENDFSGQEFGGEKKSNLCSRHRHPFLNVYVKSISKTQGRKANYY